VKRILVSVLALTLAASFILSGCTQQAATTAPATAPTTAPTAAQPIELIMNDHNPAASGPGQTNIYWVEQVNKLAAGRLHITIYSGGSLLSGEEAYRGVQTGVCDIAQYVVDTREGFALNLIMSLPFMGWPKEHVEDKYMTLMNEFPEMRAEWKGVSILSVMMMPPTQLHNTQKVVTVPSDIKGMKILGAETMTVAAAEEAGATAVTLDISEMATSLNSGLVQGIINHFPVCMIFGALELLPYHTIFGDGGINMSPAYLIMNTEKLNSLPPDLKQLLIDSGKIWYDKFCENTDAEIKASQAFVTEHNQTMTYLTPEQIKVWYDLVKAPIHDKWIADCEAKGLPGQAVYDRALQLAKQ
jgi:TRAP-type C4-dicarboxylate transport system substrate-binding protein